MVSSDSATRCTCLQPGQKQAHQNHHKGHSGPKTDKLSAHVGCLHISSASVQHVSVN